MCVVAALEDDAFVFAGTIFATDELVMHYAIAAILGSELLVFVPLGLAGLLIESPLRFSRWTMRACRNAILDDCPMFAIPILNIHARSDEEALVAKVALFKWFRGSNQFSVAQSACCSIDN